MDRVSGLVLTFFEQARAVGLGTQRYFEMAPTDLLAIARNPAGRVEFQRELEAINDGDLRRQIVAYVDDLADSVEDSASDADRSVDLVDRAGLTVSGSVTVAGIGTVIAGVAKGAAAGSIAGPIGMMAGGLCGLIVAGIGRSLLKQRSDGSKSDARKLRRLVG